MATVRYYGTGRRKSSVARVYLLPGTGKITINKRDMDDYFGLDTLKLIVRQPLVLTDTQDKFDVELMLEAVASPVRQVQSDMVFPELWFVLIWITDRHSRRLAS